jgi:hypothetical protein
MIKKLRSNKELVKKILVEMPATRDSDILLMEEVWNRQINSQVSLKKFFVLLKKKIIANPETIRRCRQKIQQENKKLRGETYKFRQKLEKETRSQIKFF